MSERRERAEETRNRGKNAGERRALDGGAAVVKNPLIYRLVSSNNGNLENILIRQKNKTKESD